MANDIWELTDGEIDKRIYLNNKSNRCKLTIPYRFLYGYDPNSLQNRVRAYMGFLSYHANWFMWKYLGRYLPVKLNIKYFKLRKRIKNAMKRTL